MDDTATNAVADAVEAMLCNEGSGHDWQHIRRVVHVADKLARAEGANLTVVVLSAYLHDVDDRKVTGDLMSETTLANAIRIMKDAGVGDDVAQTVLETIRATGFHKSFGKPINRTLEAHILSDADQLDAIGAVGIARTFVYGASKHRPMFTPDEAPMENFDKESYVKNEGSTVAHFFEKLLKLRTMMHTAAGRREAEIRHVRMVDYLDAFFEEVNAPREWHVRLEPYRARLREAA
jgi:uncharacterized protein